MTVKDGLLALLVERPRYGYELRAEFEGRTGGTWPLNVGQVYTTLARLERDGLVVADEGGEQDQQFYAVTDAGREQVRTWFATPVRREGRPRDELAIKVALAVTTPGVDARAVLQAQRTDTLRSLQDLTRLKARGAPDDPTQLAWALVLDNLVFQAEAEVRWLDACEAKVARASAAAAAPATTPDPLPRKRKALR